MLRDVEHFQSRLGKIDGFEDAADYLFEIIRGREVKSSSPAPSASTATEQPKEEGTTPSEPGAD